MTLTEPADRYAELPDLNVSQPDDRAERVRSVFDHHNNEEPTCHPPKK